MYKKGYKFERDLKLNLEKDGWEVIRSGGSKKPDLVAAKNGKIIIIECKATSKNNVYLDKAEVDNLKKVAKAFRGESMFAIKQKNKGWTLVTLERLRKAGKNYSIALD